MFSPQVELLMDVFLVLALVSLQQVQTMAMLWWLLLAVFFVLVLVSCPQA